MLERLGIAALVAAIRAFVERWLKRLADANAGAAQQRSAQDLADATAALEAKEKRNAISALDDADLRARADRWRV